MSSIPQPDIPRRRRSSFQTVQSDSSKTEPAAAPSAAPDAAAPPPQPVVSNKKRPAQTVDILLSVPDDLKARMVNTIAWTTPRTGIRHQQVFIRKSIEMLCEKLEQEFNDGQPFEAVADTSPYGD